MTEFGGFWRRVGAYLIDTIILNIAAGLVGTIFGFSLMAQMGMDNPDPTAFTAAQSFGTLFGLAVGWLYSAYLESSAWQATIGKKALGMVVTDLNGNRISFLRATGRYFAKFVSAIILLIGYIMVAFTERKQGLHDILAGTLVVKGEPGQGVNANIFS